MGILCTGLGLILPGDGGHIALAIAATDEIARIVLCLIADAQRIGTHIGDKTDGALTGNIHTFIQLLGDGHGAARGHIQLA